jgi:ATP-binding cassette, subfamily B, bacterial
MLAIYFEQLNQLGIEAIYKGRISFVIAQRLFTNRTADVILGIKKSKIVESEPRAH